MEIESAFLAHILEKLGVAPNEVVADGKIHRFATSKNGRDDAGYYVLHDDGLPAGSFGDWRTGDVGKWSAKGSSSLSHEDKARRDELKAARLKREAEGYAKAAESARRRWSNAKEANADHAYLKKKSVGAHGLRKAYDALLVPIYDGDELISIQSIDADGAKLFAKDSRTAGGCFMIGEPSGAVVIAEGYATGASIFEATSLPVVIAFNAGNIAAAAKRMRARFPAAKIIVAADDDYRTEAERGVNPGKREAQKAAAAVGGVVIVPPFDRSAGDVGTDWNDFAQARGADAVKEAFMKIGEPDNGGEIARLAALSPIEYDKQREASAERLGCRVSTLDAEVKKHREATEHKKECVSLCGDVEPCDEPVNLAELLDDVRATIRQFIVCEPETATAAALWIGFTWIIDHVQVAPLAIITAPEKRCGKTQLLDIIGRLSRRSLFASNISPAATFRVIEAKSPTLLIDEADAFFRDNEELRGVINSGHTRTSAYVIRTVGDNFEVKQFSTWAAKAIAGIGKLSDTIMDRAVILPLRRKGPEEKIKRLRHAEPGLFEMLARKLARFGKDHGAAIGRTSPALPGALNDRAQDNWEPLLAIADFAGGRWPADSRRAALAISGDGKDNRSAGEELLSDIRDIFDSASVERIALADLHKRLIDDETAPWATLNRGKPMSPRQLGARLKGFGIVAKAVHISAYEKPKGFHRKSFADAWTRYIDRAAPDGSAASSPDTPSPPVTRSPSSVSSEKQVTEPVTEKVGDGHPPFQSPNDVEVTESEVTENVNPWSPEKSPERPNVTRQGDQVTGETPLSGERVFEL